MSKTTSMGCRIRRLFSWFLLLGAIALGVLWSLGILNPPSAAAAIRSLEEAPGQMVYQSRQTITDQHGNRWQTIAFKRIRPDGNTSFELRLVAFPGVVAIDRSQPLTLTTSLGNTLFAMDTSDDLFTERDRPEPNVGQYNLQPLLPQLHAEIPLTLTLPMLQDDSIHLSIPSSLVQEWQTVAAS
ncbi:MAG TPA: DUF3122 domain-containing protein [Crinalium sp.]|jgi:hypothetical protein